VRDRKGEARLLIHSRLQSGLKKKKRLIWPVGRKAETQARFILSLLSAYLLLCPCPAIAYLFLIEQGR